MLVTRTSKLTGKLNTMEIQATPNDLASFDAAYKCVLDFLFGLTPEQRHFVVTGITPEELNTHAIFF